MKKLWTKLVAIGLMGTVMVAAPTPVMAEGECNGTSTAIIGDGCVEDNGNGSGVQHILNLVVEIMTMGVGILGTLGIVVVGVQYLTAGGDEAKTRKAKQRILEIVVGMALFVALSAIISFLLNPGWTNTTSDSKETNTTSMTIIESLMA